MPLTLRRLCISRETCSRSGIAQLVLVAALLPNTCGSRPQNSMWTLHLRQCEQVLANRVEILGAELVSRHHRAIRDALRVEEVFLQPCAVAALRNAVERWPDFHSIAIQLMTRAAVIRLKHEGAEHREIRGRFDERLILRSQLQQERGQGIQL